MNKLFLLSVLISSSLPLIGQANPVSPTVTLSDKDKYIVTDMHNRARCQVDVAAAKMPAMTWNELLYTVAQNYANKCVFAHNANRTTEYAALGGKGYVGENIFVIWTSSQGTFLPQAINSFASEKTNFSYVKTCSSGICGCKPNTVCGHYTQLIWADSLTVGCAQANCEGTPLGGKLIVCDYAPGGNIVGMPPYQAATTPTKSAACQAAEQVPLKFVATLSASSQNTTAKGVANVLDDNLNTYWAPKTADPQPYIIMQFAKPLNIKELSIQWAGIDHSAKSVNIEYSTKADGSNLIPLPIQTLQPNTLSTVSVNQSQIQLLKINFLERNSLNFRVIQLKAVDPTFSMKW